MIQVPPEGAAALVRVGLDWGEAEMKRDLAEGFMPGTAPGVKISGQKDRPDMISQLVGYGIELLTEAAETQ